VFRLILTGRWLGYLVLTIVFSVVASMFGVWQWDRREQAVSAIEKLDRNYDRAPEPLENFTALPGTFSRDDEWVPVTATGVYAPDEQVLIRTRPRGGQVGFDVMVPFRTDQGAIVMVNRGWVPTGAASDFPDVVPLAPTGTVTLVGRLKPGEPTLVGRGAPEGQLPSIDLRALQALTPYAIVEGFYVSLQSESPRPASAPLVALRPVLGEGPHLSYTLQWFVFALMAFLAFFWLLRQEYRVSQGYVPTLGKTKSDSDEEDALLDQS